MSGWTNSLEQFISASPVVFISKNPFHQVSPVLSWKLTMEWKWRAKDWSKVRRGGGSRRFLEFSVRWSFVSQIEYYCRLFRPGIQIVFLFFSCNPGSWDKYAYTGSWVWDASHLSWTWKILSMRKVNLQKVARFSALSLLQLFYICCNMTHLVYFG